MSDERLKCPYCAGHQIAWQHEMDAIAKCSVHGTGPNETRASVGCVALVGANGSESEMCPNCGGQGWYMNGPTEDPYQQECDLCYGTGSVERIAPTVPHHLPRKAGTPDADTKGAA